MELSAELFEATVRALKGDQVEQRKHPRAPARFKIRIIPFRHPELTDPIDVWTRDISLGGLGLVSSQRLKVGVRFVVRLPRTNGGHQCLLCTVRNCVEQPKGVFVIGSSFERIVPQSQAAPADDPAASIPASN